MVYHIQVRTQRPCSHCSYSYRAFIDWVTIGERLEGKAIREGEIERPHVVKALQMVPPPKEGEGIWIRPAYDGLRVFINSTDIWDNESD
jgi:hypothetical protein